MTSLGAALIDPASGVILQEWDAMPTVINHAGEDRTGAIVGAEFAGGAMLVARVLDAAPPRWNPPVLSQVSRVVDNIVVVTRTYGDPDLLSVKATLKARVDAAAEVERMKHITAGSGQALTYDRKRREAYDAIGDRAPSAVKYPVLSASIGVEVPDTGDAVADYHAISAIVLQREVAWATISKSIEAKRLGAKIAIDAATTVTQAEQAADVVWG